MSRFEDIDLARLPPAVLPSPDYETILAARMADLADRLAARGVDYDVGALETDYHKIIQGSGSYRELLAYARRDDAIRAVLLSSSWGTFLDHLGAAWGLVRKEVTPANPETGEAAILEDDDTFRARIQLAPEAWSTCGPEGAYLFFALAVPGVKHAAVYGPMSTRTVAGVASAIGVPAGHVHVPIVASTGDGSAAGPLVLAVQAALSADDRRPIADYVTVSAAPITAYAITATLRVGAGADLGAVKAEAERRLAAHAARQHRAGGLVLRSALFGAAYVPDAKGASIVEEVVLTTPAADVNPGAYGAPYCTAITVTVEVVD